MAARIVEVRNAVKQLIDSKWVDRESIDDQVLTPWRFDLKLKEHKGRKVYVFPSTYGGQPATRDEDEDDYTLLILVAEKYPEDLGVPPDDWTDARVEWVEQLLKWVGNPREVRILADPADPESGLWPEATDVTSVYDAEELREKALFVSLVSVTYREQAAV